MKKFHIKMSTVLWLCALILFSVCNSVSYKIMLNIYKQRYAYFVNQFTTLLYICMSISWCCWRIRVSHLVTDEMRTFSRKSLIFMGFLDALATFLAALSATNTPGQYQTILSQMSIPVCLVASYFILKTRYKKIQYVAAIVLIGGAALAILPQFTHPDLTQHTKWYAIVIFFCSVIPQASNTVYKELALKNQDLDVIYLTSWVSTAQFFIGFLFSPILTLPGFGGISFKDIPEQMGNGLRCFAGYNSTPGDDCESAWVSLIVYTIINFGYNVVGLMVFKKLSAVLAAIASAIRLPITNIVFTVHFIMRSQTESFNVYDIIGLIVVIIGYIMYQIPEAKKEEARKKSRMSSRLSSQMNSRSYASVDNGVHDTLVTRSLSKSNIPFQKLSADDENDMM